MTMLSGDCDGVSGILPPVTVSARTMHPTAVFDTYWRFAAARQRVYEARLASDAPPWTTDPVLAAHRFTNCYRAADRVSQFLITQVSYHGEQAWEEVFFRTLLFKIFNRMSTWRLLADRLGQVGWAEYDFPTYDKILGDQLTAGERLYSAAYIMPPPLWESP